MKLAHYRKMLEADVRHHLNHMDKESLITFLLDRYTIKDFKDHLDSVIAALTDMEEEESSQQ